VLKEGRAVRHFVSSGRVGFEVSVRLRIKFPDRHTSNVQIGDVPAMASRSGCLNFVQNRSLSHGPDKSAEDYSY